MPNKNKAKKDSVKVNSNDSFTINGITYPNPVQDIDPNQLEFGEWFKQEMKNNPTNIGTWRGKQYKLEHKEDGGHVKGIGSWAGKNVPGMRQYKNGGDLTKKAVNKFVADEKVIDKTMNILRNTKDGKGVSDISIKSDKALSKTTPTKPYKTTSPTKTISKNVGTSVSKKVGIKVGKKIGSKLIPGLGMLALGADIIKEIKSGGKGIKKNIKNVKDFAKTGDWGHILQGKATKTAPLQMNKTVGKIKKETYLDKRNKDYKPQSQRKK